MIDSLDDYIGKTVRVTYVSKKNDYKKTLHKLGTVTRISSKSLGVIFDDIKNDASSYGAFWFNQNELELIKNDYVMEDKEMKGFKHVAIVTLWDDPYKKSYGFALFDAELEKVTVDSFVVTNAKGDYNRTVGVIKEIKTLEEYGKNVTAQVTGVIDMSGYIERKKAAERQEQRSKKRAAIEAELDKRVRKLKDLEFYEKMANEYADKEPGLKRLVEEMKELSE